MGSIQDGRMDLCWRLRWGYALVQQQQKKYYPILFSFAHLKAESLILHFDSIIYSLLPKKNYDSLSYLTNTIHTIIYIFFDGLKWIILPKPKKSSRTRSAREDFKRLQSYTNNKNKNIWPQAQWNINLQPQGNKRIKPPISVVKSNISYVDFDHQKTFSLTFSPKEWISSSLCWNMRLFPSFQITHVIDSHIMLKVRRACFEKPPKLVNWIKWSKRCRWATVEKPS